jgi:VanZ family protein
VSAAPSRASRLAFAAWIAMFVAITIGSLLPARDLPTPAFDGFDKVEHLLGYAVLSGWSVLLFGTRRARVLALVGVIAFGIAIEFAQGVFTTTREPDAWDAVADAIGAMLAQLLAFTGLRGAWRARR